MTIVGMSKLTTLVLDGGQGLVLIYRARSCARGDLTPRP